MEWYFHADHTAFPQLRNEITKVSKIMWFVRKKNHGFHWKRSVDLLLEYHFQIDRAAKITWSESLTCSMFCPVSYCFWVWPVIWPMIWPVTWPVACNLHFSAAGHIGWFGEFPKSARIGNSFLVLLGCPFVRHNPVS